ncbi:hypothetical protein LDENG_00298350 [Lucifuga dentata]|nr:hypothetical protein LDENG_00298350 [Lucifuga dentata]
MAKKKLVTPAQGLRKSERLLQVQKTTPAKVESKAKKAAKASRGKKAAAAAENGNAKAEEPKVDAKDAK